MPNNDLMEADADKYIVRFEEIIGILERVIAKKSGGVMSSEEK